MKRSVMFATATVTAALAGQAWACETMQDAMARFEEVKNAYIAAAPTLKPEQFTVWTNHLTTFGDTMGKMDYPGACAALDAAALELGFADAGGEADEGGDVAATGGESAGGKAGSGKAGDGGGGTTAPAATATEETAVAPAPAPAPTPAQVGQPEPATAAPAGIPGVWQQCPRGRCRN